MEWGYVPSVYVNLKAKLQTPMPQPESTEISAAEEGFSMEVSHGDSMAGTHVPVVVIKEKPAEKPPKEKTKKKEKFVWST